MNELDFTSCETDPCLLKNNEEDVFSGLYVDDLQIIGDEKKVFSVVKNLEKRYKIRVIKDVKEYIKKENPERIVISTDSILQGFTQKKDGVSWETELKKQFPEKMVLVLDGDVGQIEKERNEERNEARNT